MKTTFLLVLTLVTHVKCDVTQAAVISPQIQIISVGKDDPKLQEPSSMLSQLGPLLSYLGSQVPVHSDDKQVQPMIQIIAIQNVKEQNVKEQNIIQQNIEKNITKELIKPAELQSDNKITPPENILIENSTEKNELNFNTIAIEEMITETSTLIHFTNMKEQDQELVPENIQNEIIPSDIHSPPIIEENIPNAEEIIPNVEHNVDIIGPNTENDKLSPELVPFENIEIEENGDKDKPVIPETVPDVPEIIQNVGEIGTTVKPSPPVLESIPIFEHTEDIENKPSVLPETAPDVPVIIQNVGEIGTTVKPLPPVIESIPIFEHTEDNENKPSILIPEENVTIQNLDNLETNLENIAPEVPLSENENIHNVEGATVSVVPEGIESIPNKEQIAEMVGTNTENNNVAPEILPPSGDENIHNIEGATVSEIVPEGIESIPNKEQIAEIVGTNTENDNVAPEILPPSGDENISNVGEADKDSPASEIVASVTETQSVEQPGGIQGSAIEPDKNVPAPVNENIPNMEQNKENEKPASEIVPEVIEANQNNVQINEILETTTENDKLAPEKLSSPIVEITPNTEDNKGENNSPVVPEVVPEGSETNQNKEQVTETHEQSNVPNIEPSNENIAQNEEISVPDTQNKNFTFEVNPSQGIENIQHLETDKKPTLESGSNSLQEIIPSKEIDINKEAEQIGEIANEQDSNVSNVTPLQLELQQNTEKETIKEPSKDVLENIIPQEVDIIKNPEQHELIPNKESSAILENIPILDKANNSNKEHNLELNTENTVANTNTVQQSENVQNENVINVNDNKATENAAQSLEQTIEPLTEARPVQIPEKETAVNLDQIGEPIYLNNEQKVTILPSEIIEENIIKEQITPIKENEVADVDKITSSNLLSVDTSNVSVETPPNNINKEEDNLNKNTPPPGETITILKEEIKENIVSQNDTEALKPTGTSVENKTESNMSDTPSAGTSTEGKYFGSYPHAPIMPIYPPLYHPPANYYRPPPRYPPYRPPYMQIPYPPPRYPPIPYSLE